MFDSFHKGISVKPINLMAFGRSPLAIRANFQFSRLTMFPGASCVKIPIRLAGPMWSRAVCLFGAGRGVVHGCRAMASTSTQFMTYYSSSDARGVCCFYSTNTTYLITRFFPTIDESNFITEKQRNYKSLTIQSLGYKN